jgi:hypothetical protein
MFKEIKQAILFTLVTMVLLGGAYHLAIWAIGQAVFASQAEGSLIKEHGRPRPRIYIGAAPGVGKTDEMLRETHALRARGLDVIVRDIALRAVADEVTAKAASYRTREGLEPALIPERVIICMSSNALAPRVIRTGARIAGRLGSRWYAVYVETPQERSDRIELRAADALIENIHLAEISAPPSCGRQGGSALRRPHRLRPPRGRDARHLRAERQDPLGTPLAGVDAGSIPQRGARRGGAGRPVERGARSRMSHCDDVTT